MRIPKSSGTPFHNYPAPDSEIFRHPIPELSGTFCRRKITGAGQKSFGKNQLIN